MINIIERNMQQREGRVTKVYLELGELAGVDHAALMFSFQVARQDSIVEDAELCILNIPAKGICLVCQRQQDIVQYYDPCCQCGSVEVKPTQGEEVRIQSMEVK